MTRVDTEAPLSTFATLLQRWCDGDAVAIDELLQRVLPRVRALAHERLGATLRRKDETHDIVQDAMLEFLRYGQRFKVADEGAFHALLARIVVNVIADHHAWFTRKRRDMHRESGRAGSGSTVIDLASPATDPGAGAARTEELELIRLAIELMPSPERDILVRRQFDGESFVAIGAALDMGADTVRKRFDRALPRLAQRVRSLRLGALLEASSD
jgi:RNA polymerase sigma factor (sigma-70 family)